MKFTIEYLVFVAISALFVAVAVIYQVLHGTEIGIKLIVLSGGMMGCAAYCSYWAKAFFEASLKCDERSTAKCDWFSHAATWAAIGFTVAGLIYAVLSLFY